LAGVRRLKKRKKRFAGGKARKLVGGGLQQALGKRGFVTTGLRRERGETYRETFQQMEGRSPDNKSVLRGGGWGGWKNWNAAKSKAEISDGGKCGVGGGRVTLRGKNSLKGQRNVGGEVSSNLLVSRKKRVNQRKG